MKAEKINQDQVRFTIDADDLISRNLRVSELAYGSQKTQALFDDMMRQAMDQFGMDFSEKPLMIEAIPLSDNKLSITVTKVDGLAELGGLIGANLPGVKNQNGDLFQMGGRPGQESGEDAHRSEGNNSPAGEGNRPEGCPFEISMQSGVMDTNEPVTYIFRSLEPLMQIAEDIPERFPLKNRLFKDVGNGDYYLICEYRNIGAKTRHLVAMLSQYADEWYAGKHTALMAEEHSTKVLGSTALQKLGVVQRG